MLTQDERNWLEENDVLDRHIFGRLTEEESARLQFLLDKDPSFQEEFDLNIAMAAAIRHNGRLEMKQRLQTSIKEDAGTPTEPVVLPMTARESGRREGFPLLLKLAAAVLVLAGASVIFYQLFFSRPVQTPMADEQIKKESTPAQTETPKESVRMTPPDESKKVAAKKSTGKQKAEEKPMIAATPPENILQKRNQRFHAESLMMPKPNEVDAVVITEDVKTETPTKILFKNPTDLIAVNIKETQSEENGRLGWFYVVYENRILNVYIDNSKYLALFRNARLTESASALVIEIRDAAYTVDLSAKDKFKKAVLKP